MCYICFTFMRHFLVLVFSGIYVFLSICVSLCIGWYLRGYKKIENRLQRNSLYIFGASEERLSV